MACQILLTFHGCVKYMHPINMVYIALNIVSLTPDLFLVGDACFTVINTDEDAV